MGVRPGAGLDPGGGGGSRPEAGRRGGPGGGRGAAAAGSGPVPGQPLTAPQHVRQLYALVSETLRYSSVLEKLLAGAALLRAEKKLPLPLAKVRGTGGRPLGGGARAGRVRLTHVPAGAGVRPALRQGPEVRGPLEGAGPAAPRPAGG